jgi:excisionase family DNA binding protein
MAHAVEAAPDAWASAPPRPFLSVSEAATLLGVSRVTVWRWIKSGRLSPSRLGHRTVRIQRDDILRLLRPLPSVLTPPPGHTTAERGHFVLFYEADAYLEKSVAEFLAGGLSRGNPALVVATPAHCAGIADRLIAAGIDVAAARAEKRLVELDAAQTLDQFTIDGRPDAARFDAVVGTLVGSMGSGCRIFGEMVALLVARGNAEAALALEGMWNELQLRQPFALLCGYPMDQLASNDLARVVDDTCGAHTAVVPTEAYADLDTSDARLREIVALQQKAASLEHALRAERAARAEIQAALQIRDEFISIASHELRTPVSVLMAQAQLTLRRLQRQGHLEPERVAAALQMVGTQADKLARLISQLLDVSRLEAGKLALEPHDTDLVSLVEQIVSGTRPLSDTHTLSLIAPAELECQLDALRIEQVLSNLLDNAMKYSPAGGGVEVSLGQCADGSIELAVRDHGLGIPEEKRAHIFERFYQAHDTGQRGMGLGLYVSRHIVEMHGGQLHAEFPSDGGTCMRITLPYVAPAQTLPIMDLASD